MKHCVFYYATVVSGNDWSATGELLPEPLRQEGSDPLGRLPDFCCDTLKTLLGVYPGTQHILSVRGGSAHYRHQEGKSWRGFPHIIFTNMWDDPLLLLRFCPFCGAQITWREDLEVRVEEFELDSRPRKGNRWVPI